MTFLELVRRRSSCRSDVLNPCPEDTDTGFAHYFRPKIQGLFKDFPGPYFEISRTLCKSNEKALGTKTSVFTHFVRISRMLYFDYLNICFHSLLFTLNPLSINISPPSSIKNKDF